MTLSIRQQMVQPLLLPLQLTAARMVQQAASSFLQLHCVLAMCPAAQTGVHSEATAAQATAAAARCVSLVRRDCPLPTLLLGTTLCSAGCVKKVGFRSRCPLQARALACAPAD